MLCSAAPISRNGKSRESVRKMPLSSTRKMNGNKTIPLGTGAAARGAAENLLDDSPSSAESLPLEVAGGGATASADNSGTLPGGRGETHNEDAGIATELARTAMEEQRRQLAQLFDEVDAAGSTAALPVDPNAASAAHSTKMLEKDLERLKHSMPTTTAPPSPYKNSQAIRNPRDPLGILSRSGGGMRAGPIAS
eukprot:COSAG05_NODE_1227_length_5452_cov_12.619279_2_plen_194_part_00